MHSKPCYPVTLIIPCSENIERLLPLLTAIDNADAIPTSILIVDSSNNLNQPLPSSLSICSTITILHSSHSLYPGAARNLGLHHVTTDWIAFLDVNTIPSETWLRDAFQFLKESPKTQLLEGSTQYRARTYLQRLFIIATYGESPICTLPGTLVHRTVFSIVGTFMPCIRAGEDTDWIIRVKQFGIPRKVFLANHLEYSHVPSNISLLLRKWYRNYSSCAPVVFHLEFQKTIYLLCANIVLLLIAFNWNAIIAGWRESSIFYLANITKSAFVTLISLYFFFRGFLMPLKRGTNFFTLLPFQWVLIGAISCLIDITKLFAFFSRPPRNV